MKEKKPVINIEKPIVSTLSNLIASNVSLIIGIASGIIVTRSLGPELKGEYANLKLVVSLYAPFLLFGYQGGVLYYGLRQKLDLQQFFWTGAALSFGLGLVCMPILAALVQNGILGSIAQNSTPLHVWLALGTIPALFLNAYMERVIRVYHLFRAANVRLIIALVVPLLFYLVLFFTLGINLTWALVGLLLGQLSALVMNFYFVIQRLKVQFCWQGRFIFYPFTYGYKDLLVMVVGRSNDKIDQIILTFLLAPAAFGIYVVGVGLSNLVNKIPSSYITVFYNQIAKRSPQEGLPLYARAQRITFILTALAAIALAILAYPLIYLMYGNAFTAAAWVVVLYTPGLIFQVAARVSIKFYAGQGKPLKNSLVYIAGIVAGLPFYFWLIPKYGIRGAAIASSIAYFAAFSFSFWQLNRDYGVSLRDIVIPQRDDIKYVKMQLAKIPVLKRWLSLG
jgi:O-antigen/teichoic acid export membrane protein